MSNSPHRQAIAARLRGKVEFINRLPSVALFIDLDHVLAALYSPNYLGQPDTAHIAQSLGYAARQFGRVQTAVIYLGQSTDKNPWIHYGMEISSVPPEDINLDIFDRCLATEPQRPEIVVIVSGDPSRHTLIYRLRHRVQLLAVIGGVASTPNIVRRTATYFVPLTDVVEINIPRRSTEDEDVDAMTEIIQQLSLAEERMPFVGLSYFIHNWMTNYQTNGNVQRLVNEAEQQGIIRLYDHENVTPDKQPVKACALVIEHAAVKKALRR